MLKIVIVRRELGLSKRIALSLTSIALCLAVSALIIYAITGSTNVVFAAFTSFVDLNTLRYLGTLTVIALGLCIAYRAKLWNLGADGQLVIGAILATWFALYTPLCSSSMGIVLGLVVAALGGMAWSFIAIALRIWIGVNEALATLLLNYVAYYLANHLVEGPWRGVAVHGYPETDLIPRACWIPCVRGYSFSPYIVAMALLLTVLIHVIVKRTRFGLAVKALGTGEALVELSGISAKKVALLAFLMSGALAGLAGGIELFEVQRKLILGTKFSAGLGFTAIIVAWLAQLEPLLVPLVSYFVGALLLMMVGIQIAGAGVGDAVAQVIVGVLLVSTLVSNFFVNYRMKIVKVKGVKL